MMPLEMDPTMLTFVGVVLVAVCGLVGTLGASWISNRANNRQKAAQALIDEKKVDREEFDSLTRELRLSLADVRAELTAEREARVRSDTRAQAAEVRAERAERRMDSLAAAVAAHGQWDLLILAEVRKTNEDFPDPPPLSILPYDAT